MRKIILSAVCLVMPLMLHAATNDAAQALAKHLDFTSYSANFRQDVLQKNNGLKQQSNGTMALLRPSYFRWESMAPTHQIIIADKKTLQIYDVDLMQVTKEKVDQSQAFNPAKLLSISAQNLEKDFKISYANLQHCAQSFAMQDLTNKDSPKVYLCFKNNKLVQMQMINNLGESTIFSFSNIKINPPLNESSFKLKLPEGVDVVSR